jgi:glycosyltransferase involved in cell wall biosynthesis
VPELFIGITSWNSGLFLAHCLRAICSTTSDTSTEVVVLDNCSDDNSCDIARSFGAKLLRERCSQADALNRLAKRSEAPYTLLMHPDVILINRNWFNLCRKKLTGSTVLISPEDIGCGPLTRPFGIGKPESSFLLFKTTGLRTLRSIRWRKRWGLPVPQVAIDFYADHITHSLPEQLSSHKLDWCPMAVHWSDRVRRAIFKPLSDSRSWSSELSFLRYGLGNFYSVDGVITHYHNWYDRIASAANRRLHENREQKDYFPSDYIRAYTTAFLSDLETGKVVIPKALTSDREPVAL